MRFTERVLAWLRRERADASDLVRDTQRRLDDDLTRRERELAATPEERLELLQDQIDENDAELQAIRDRLERERGGDA
jgi:hypothetical protein